MTLVLLILATLLAAYVLPSLARKLVKVEALPTEKDATEDITFYGGPLGPKLEASIPASSKKEWFTIPYAAKNEEGEEIREHLYNDAGEPVIEYVKRAFAFYRQVTDAEYFYVRDISEQEAVAAIQTGQIPSVEESEDA